MRKDDEDVTTNVVMEVDRSAIGSTRLIDVPMPTLADAQVRMRVDRFAITANNVTYAGFGDLLGYWDFFPTGDAGWGRVPAVGWAEVVESRVDGIAPGARYFGWFPMAAYVDLTATPTSDGFRDDGPHRSGHVPVYRSYIDSRCDPLLPADDRAGSGDVEDRHALLRALFLTGFLAESFIAALPGGPVEQIVVLSASSKTAISLAHRASMRGSSQVVGFTSPRNIEFVSSIADGAGARLYDSVHAYGDAVSLPIVPTAVVDMAGVGDVVAALHRHLGDAIVSSLMVGRSHHDAPMAMVGDGPNPEFFIATGEAERQVAAHGAAGYQARSAAALAAFVEESRGWLAVERRTGAAGATDTWDAVYRGVVPPSVGRVVSLHD